MATVLVVDDSLSNRDLVRTVLRIRGYRTVEARTGLDALALLHVEPVDMVLADVMMPKMDGYQLLQAIRTDPSLWRIPVVFYTAHYESARLRGLGTQVGVTHVVAKTGDLDALLDAVQDTLREAC